ncbi:B3 domain-containing transcription factor LEC2 [Mercurialis annua]|uniref:B3 domain-containing transcription factor LEC2 n=1 Tax=Mercurialis annua TaxID=3986 RepID=UPI00215E6592|nr:B3 domain-containing transcription factor LEC2 [Mercurialis annua]
MENLISTNTSKPVSYPSTSTNSSPEEDSIPNPFQFHPIDQAGQYSASAFSLYHPLWNVSEIQRPRVLQPNGASERRVVDAYTTKVARNKRKLARQRTLTKHSNSAAHSLLDARRLTFNLQSGQSSINRDLYKFCTPDNKKLRLLLRKELKTSDVGSLGRIILPKREAEENLPVLSDKEGILVSIRDVNSNKEWSLKFKYWSNNKSRMYVLENTGEFVKQNGMGIGDSLTLYEDENKKLYFSVEKAEKQKSDEQHSMNHNYIYIPHTYQAREEEEASLELLIEQLKHEEQQEEVVSLSMDIAPSYRHKDEDKNFGPFNNFTSISIYPQPVVAAIAPMQPSSSAHGSMRVVDDHYVDDFYTGLDLLPDAYRYKF